MAGEAPNPEGANQARSPRIPRRVPPQGRDERVHHIRGEVQGDDRRQSATDQRNPRDRPDDARLAGGAVPTDRASRTGAWGRRMANRAGRVDARPVPSVKTRVSRSPTLSRSKIRRFQTPSR